VEKVLIIDDDPRYLELLQFILEDENMEVRALREPEAAQAVAESWRPDVIVTDVSMPGLDGYALVAGLKSAVGTQNIPVIFVTARGQAYDKHKGRDLGVVEYLMKPFSMAGLVERIRRLAKRTVADNVA